MSTERTNLRRAPEPTDKSLNPTVRRRQRRSTSSDPARCCSCTRHATCSSSRQTHCECRRAGRQCVSCCPSKGCQNRHKDAELGSPVDNEEDPLDGSFSLPCLPNQDTTASSANHSPSDAKETPLLSTQDSLVGDHHAENVDDEPTDLAPVQSPPAAQGRKRRSGIVTD